MTDPAASTIVRLAAQHPTTAPSLCERISGLLTEPSLERIRIIVAYANWDGLGLISDALEGFLRRGGEVQTIYGIGNGVTTPDCLLYSVYLGELYGARNYAGTISHTYANSTFHPKTFSFKFSNYSLFIVGSANLTGGGLLRNSELALEVSAPSDSPISEEIELYWSSVRQDATEVSVDLVRNLRRNGSLASEPQEHYSDRDASLPLLPSRVVPARKPLFRKVLELSDKKKKRNVLLKLDGLSQRPRQLYLQILANETGGQLGRPGYQVQIPVSTLRSYFGVGPNDTKEVEFSFERGDPFRVQLTHFGNNTHRIRLLPVRDIPRPAIVIFNRVSENSYHCTIVPPAKYASILRTKCTEQTRSGARRWGID